MTAETITSLVISCIMMLVGVITFIINMIRNSRHDLEEHNKAKDDMKASLLELNLMTKNINRTTDDIKAEIRTINKSVNDFDCRISVIKNEQENMWHQIDAIKEKIKI